MMDDLSNHSIKIARSSCSSPFVFVVLTSFCNSRVSLMGKTPEARPEAVSVHLESAATVLDDLRG